MNRFLLVGSANARVGFSAGAKILRAGGSALDAVEAVIRRVESNPADHSVGVGGLPNILGTVELDASIMDGRTRNAGAVCAVRYYAHPITIARRVMERLPHVLLAGEGAERFAASMGEPRAKLLTPAARAIYRSKVSDSPRYNTLRELVAGATRDPEIAAMGAAHPGTVNVIARDAAGHLASGVSTSGWAWKYPGRVGDSPIVGAGNYADDRYGACACTGYGEMALRAVTAHSVVLYLRMGHTLAAAAREAMRDLRSLPVPFPPGMNLIAVDARGRHVGYTTETERQVRYLYLTHSMDKPIAKPRTVVPLAPRDEKG